MDLVVLLPAKKISHLTYDIRNSQPVTAEAAEDMIKKHR